MRLVRSCVAVFAVLAATAAPPVQATYIGDNGKIAFERQGGSPAGIWTINPDGSGAAPLTEGDNPSWSPNGGRLAFGCPAPNGSEVCTANADGSSVNPIDGHGLYPQDDPTWSPDGTKLAIQSAGLCGSGCGYSDIWRVNAADGDDHIQLINGGLAPSWSRNSRVVYVDFYAAYQYPPTEIHTVEAQVPGHSTKLTDADSGSSPDWSPDGKKIVFSSYRDGNYEIYVMNADGSNQTRLTNNSDSDGEPAWSPDATKIVFARAVPAGNSDLFLMNPDGTGVSQLTSTPGISESRPAWQPIPQPGYPRPKGATPLRVSLVPAFERCEAPNRTHGPPLAFASCNPPRQRGQYAAFGTANGSKAVGSVGFKAIPGAPDEANNADVEISVNMTDVRRKLDGADALGSLDLPVPLRLTDRNNGAYNEEQATVTDLGAGLSGYINDPLRLEVPCVETADPAVGSTCSATTSVNALFPYQGAAVQEGKRSVWQLDQLAVWDGGEDGYVESRDDNTVLAVQGVFVP